MTRTPPSAPPSATPSAIRATRTPPRRRVPRLLVVVLLVGLAVLAALLARRAAKSALSSAAPNPPDLHSEGPGPVGGADGVVPGGTTVFDGAVPAVANLDADLLDALRRAARAASGDGVVFQVNSGWRSPRYQNQLLREAVSTYGTAAEAARWVATAKTSPHVSGEAVDLGRSAATAWLSEHGAAYGLCRIYQNEPWHYELRTEAIDHGCPRRYADPTEDPRMRQ
ncbi:D-alanyl-D-alanine carboxypeptidase family protein [Streptomyces sp. NBC_00237]|uniref:D-alanyl-D-alanine carboxypeptidase family protein n=1 Tax=Streptomyces sp. NBC_00237 TaxID=2975687 RepID=UPI002254EB46|nr:D-alanyl-D-alanine carboxypeptidase family protein [Streptomyces sp. NBC_00237]MCX5205187.1 D-alanyl-D-alanine carboxypeptidase family protein [Streptomyces sp. NBC_00237]